MSQQINLFNPIFLKQKKYFSAVTMWQALGLILIGSMALAAYANFRLSALERQAAAASAQLAQAQQQLTQVAGLYGGKQREEVLEAQIKKAEAEARSLQDVLDMLRKGDLGHTGGYAEYLEAFARQSVSGLWLTGFQIVGAGSEIALYGRALNPELVATYINKLKAEPVLQGITFAALEIRTPSATAGSADGTGADTASYIEFSLQSAGARQQSARAGEGAR